MTTGIRWSFGKSDTANSGPSSCPSLDLDHDLAVFSSVGEFLKGGHRVVSAGDGTATRNVKSIRRQNGFTLIFVQSGHGRVLCRMKTRNVQRARQELIESNFCLVI